MFTVCPKCTLTLAVTAGDLRIGQGYVRCGRCSNVFNALLKLTEAPGEGDAAAATPPQADPASTSQIRQAISSAALSAASPQSPPAPQPTPAPSAALARPQTPTPTSQPTPTPRAVQPAGMARRSGDTLPGRSEPLLPARGGSPAMPARAPTPEAPGAQDQRETDADAIGQFEQVLQTLGINLLEDQAAAQPSAASFTIEQPTARTRRPTDTGRPPQPPAEQDTPDYNRVENIVMEGDGVNRDGSDTQADEPADELDIFTRRLAATTARDGVQRTAKAADEIHNFEEFDGARHADVIEFDLTDTDTADAAADTRGSELRATDAAAIDDDAVVELDIPGLRSSTRRWPEVLGCTALAVLLLLQALNHWHSALAASPIWGAPVSRLYAALGMPVQPHWNLGAYDVRQEGAQTDASNEQVIRVRLSLANRAPRAQPTPLLRLTLLDRYGKRTAQRDLTPADYWPTGRSPESFMASDERIDSEIAVRDPSAASASFELDVCLREVGGAVRCAGDATTPMADARVP